MRATRGSGRLPCPTGFLGHKGKRIALCRPGCSSLSKSRCSSASTANGPLRLARDTHSDGFWHSDAAVDSLIQCHAQESNSSFLRRLGRSSTLRLADSRRRPHICAISSVRRMPPLRGWNRCAAIKERTSRASGDMRLGKFRGARAGEMLQGAFLGPACESWSGACRILRPVLLIDGAASPSAILACPKYSPVSPHSIWAGKPWAGGQSRRGRAG
jgi:hypothetical protein